VHNAVFLTEQKPPNRGAARPARVSCGYTVYYVKTRQIGLSQQNPALSCLSYLKLCFYVFYALGFLPVLLPALMDKVNYYENK
jgi:hypothetical protein